MDQLDKGIKRALDGRIGDLNAKPTMSAQAVRRAKVRRGLFGVTSAGLGIALVGAGFLGAQAFTGGKTESPATFAPAAEPQTEPTPPKATSPVVTVASGRQDASDWSLRAYLAEGQDSNTSGLPMLCVEWKFASQIEGDDFNCVIDEAGRFEGPLMFQLMSDGTPTHSFYGPIPSNTERVELKLKDGSVASAELYESPGPLGASNKFFVAFTTSDDNPLVVGYAEDGSILFERGDYAEN